METRLHFDIQHQPDSTTCGPTCLQAVYDYHGDPIPLDQVIREVTALEDGGTLAVMLGCHALRRGYDARIYTFNLHMFDPTWFRSDGHVASVDDMLRKLDEQSTRKNRPKLRYASAAYAEFLQLGGVLRMEDLNGNLIRRHLKQSTPVLTGLSATFLYREPREIPATSLPDDINGEPSGHFVVLCGYDADQRKVLVADPLHPTPVAETRVYEMTLDRIISSILLGIVTYDANLLTIRPRREPRT